MDRPPPPAENPWAHIADAPTTEPESLEAYEALLHQVALAEAAGNVRRMTLEERRELGLRDNTAPPVRCEPPPELLRLMRRRDERKRMAEARLPHNCRERRLPFLLCRHRRKDAEARAGDDLIVKLAIDAPLDLVRKVLKYV